MLCQGNGVFEDKATGQIVVLKRMKLEEEAD
jgi:hypothetical protein